MRVVHLYRDFGGCREEAVVKGLIHKWLQGVPGTIGHACQVEADFSMPVQSMQSVPAGVLLKHTCGLDLRHSVYGYHFSTREPKARGQPGLRDKTLS